MGPDRRRKSKGKVNSSLYYGGPEGMMRTFTDLTGAEFDGYLLTGFWGFRDMINVLGGLEIDIPRALSDRHAQASIKAGLQCWAQAMPSPSPVCARPSPTVTSVVSSTEAWP